MLARNGQWIFQKNKQPSPQKDKPMRSPISPGTRSIVVGAGLFIGLFGAQPAAGQVTPDQQAEMLLNSARKAYNEKNYAFATLKFREYLGKFGNHKDVPAARYGLALTL